MFKWSESTQTMCQLPNRWRVAGEWEHLLEIAEAGPIRARLRVLPLSRRILAARPEIEQLTAALYSAEPVSPDGLEMARRLVRDGAGPVFDPRADRSLAAAIDECICALDPSTSREMPYGRSSHAHGRRPRLRSPRVSGAAARRSPRHRRR